MRQCPNCDSRIPITANVCPYCTRDVYSGDVGAGGALIVFILIIVAFVKGCGG